ncbi:MAG: hypothetical protein M0Q44_20940 [Methylobacter sp.]|jgi:hypothetical protein|nr:hypothetical protein [Methylobacter sp.]
MTQQDSSPNKVQNDPSQQDWFLQSLVKMVTTNGFEISITLHVGGLLVSGLLASGRQYFEYFGEEFANAISDADAETVESIKSSYVNLGANIYPTKEEDSLTVPPCYIHLRDAKYFSPNGNPLPTNHGIWWRGRISEVQGFNLGSLSNS